MALAQEFSKTAQAISSVALAPLPGRVAEADWASLQHAVGSALERGETHYTDRPGILPLREKVTSMLASRFHIAINAAAEAMITCSLVEARFVVLQQLLAAGEGVWCPAALSDRIAGAATVRRTAIVADAGAARLVYLASSTGEVELRRILEETRDDAVVLFEADDPSSSFHPAQIEAFAARTVTVGPLADASWQLGYLIAPAKLSAGLRDFKQALTICSTNLSQWAALAAMEAV